MSKPKVLTLSKCSVQGPLEKRIRLDEEPITDTSDSKDLNETNSFGIIDSHCHMDMIFDRLRVPSGYTFSEFKKEFANSFSPKLTKAISVFCHPYSWLKYEGRFDNEEELLYAFGCHPHFAFALNFAKLKLLERLMARPKTVALGEIGLDYSQKNTVSHALQKLTFKSQLKLAKALNKPVCLHVREAGDDAFKCMEEVNFPKFHKIHVHCFNGTLKECQKWLDLYPNCKIGVTGLVTFKYCRNLHEMVKTIPLDRLVLETDAPYFLPYPAKRVSDKFDSHPGMIEHVARWVALIRDENLSQIIAQTTSNAMEVYDIDNTVRKRTTIITSKAVLI